MLAFNMVSRLAGREQARVWDTVLIRGSQITESVQLASGSSALFRFVRVWLPWKLLFRLSCRIKDLGVGIWAWCVNLRLIGLIPASRIFVFSLRDKLLFRYNQDINIPSYDHVFQYSQGFYQGFPSTCFS